MKVNIIRTRLGLAFACLIAILIAVGWLGLGHMAKVNSEVDQILDREWKKVQLSREALRYSSRNNRITMQILLLKERAEIDPLLVERARNSENISELLRQISDQVESAGEQKLLDAIWNARTPYVESYQEAIGLLLDDGKEKEARLAMVNVTLPLLLKYHNAWEEFVKFQGDQIDRAGKLVANDFSKARTEVFSLLLIGTVLGIAVALFVTRHLSRAHGKLELSERRFRQLCVAAPIGISLMDAERRCLYTNARWWGITGRSEKDSLGEGWKQAIHPDDAAKVFRALNDPRSGADFDSEFRLRHSGGEIRWVHSRMTALRNDIDGVTGYVVTVEDITERRRADAKLAELHEELLEVSRQAGKVEVATGILHNVGNVLNSVNVASTCIRNNIQTSKASALSKVVGLLDEHKSDLGAFFANDPKGAIIPRYLAQLSEHLCKEQSLALDELVQLEKGIEHIKEIVSSQQRSAKTNGAVEILKVADLVEDSLKMSVSPKDAIQIVKEYEDDFTFKGEKHKALQILVNLMRNATQACLASSQNEKQVTIRATRRNDHVCIAVSDNGTGIEPENLKRIFVHGFTTKKDGHGFGLCSAQAAAREMGGTLLVQSEGSAKGATFTLELPAGPISGTTERISS